MKLALLLLAALSLTAQTSPPNPLLNTADANALTLRIGQLIESTAVVVPGLAKSSAPLADTTRQLAASLQVTPGNSGTTFDLLHAAQTYLLLADATPKPYPLPDTARRQFAELRDATERLQIHARALLDQKERQLLTPDRNNVHRYEEANTKINPPAPALSRVVFFGDSITDFWRLNEYFTGRDYINRGISGQVTDQMLARMKSDVINLHPKAMLVMAGVNDIARGVPVRYIENNIAMMADLCKANGIKPLIASILPVSDHHKADSPRYEMTKTHNQAYILEVNRWLREYCEIHDYVYVDYFSAMRDPSGQLIADLSDDGLHPNGKGYRIMSPIATKALDQALAETSPQQQPPAKKRRLF